MTREAWLLDATERLKPLFAAQGATIPPVRVSVGFPGGKGNRTKAIGQIWQGSAPADGIPQVFISPVLSDGVTVLSTLIHELVHACTPGAGHGKAFKRLALAVGLTGKMTATVAGHELSETCTRLLSDLGPYPHSELRIGEGRPGAQRNRHVKMQCDHCGYIARAAAKWIDEQGPLTCPCSHVPMRIE